MPQTSYDFNMAIGFPGLIAGIGPKRIASYANEDVPVPFGVGVIQGASANQCRLPLKNSATIVLDADLVASNSVAGTVNGTALTATVYATSHLATMTAIAAKIAAIDGVLSATVGGTSNRTITVLAENGETIALTSFAVTLGAGQAGVTLAHTTSDVLLGLAVHEHVEQTASAVARYEANSAVGVMRQGTMWVTCEDAVDPSDSVYIRFAASGGNTQLGAVRTDTDSGTAFAATGCRFMTSASAGALVQIEVNLP